MRSLSRLIRFYIRMLLPALLAVLCVFYGFVNGGILLHPELMPLMMLMFLFYWACYWPRLMHPGLLFALGLLEDILSGGVIGLRSMLYLLVYSLILSQRRLLLKEPFPVVWTIFALTSLGYTALMLCAFRLFEGVWWLSPQPFVQWLVTVAAYPLVHQLCLGLQSYLVRVRPTTGRRL